MWVWKSLTLKCFARVFSLKSTPYKFEGNEGIYSMGKEFSKTLFHFAKLRVSQVPCEMTFLAKYSRIGQASMTLQLLVMCFTRGFFVDCFTHKPVMNCTDSSFKADSSPISHTHPLQINPHKYREMIEWITTKFVT